MEPVKKTTTTGKSSFAALSLNCRDASLLQSQSLDTKLTLIQRLGLAVHLILCKFCRRYGSQIRFLRNAAREHPDDLSNAGPENLSPEARQRICQRIKSEQHGE